MRIIKGILLKSKILMDIRMENNDPYVSPYWGLKVKAKIIKHLEENKGECFHYFGVGNGFFFFNFSFIEV